MRNPLFMDEDYNDWVSITQVRRVIMRLRDRELRPYDITTQQARILFCMHACDVFGDMKTPTNISKYTLHEHNTVLGLLERMEEKGLIKKCKGLEKKNMVSVMFTDKGLRAYELSTERESIHKLMSHLSKRERRQLRSILEKLLDKALEETGKSARGLYKLS